MDKSRSALFLLYVFALSFSAARAGADDPGPKASLQAAATDSAMSVRTLVAEALARSPALSASRVRAEAMATRPRQESAWEDPQVSLEFFATPITYADPLRHGMETDYAVTQAIPLFGRNGAMRDAAEAGARAANQSALVTERNIVAQVKQSYAMLLTAQKQLAVNNDATKVLEQIVISVRTRYSVGSASFADVLKAQVELDKAANERSRLTQGQESAAGMIDALLGRTAGTRRLTVAEEELHPLKLTLRDACDAAQEHRPDLRAMAMEIEMSRAELDAAKRECFPDVMVRGMYKDMKEGTDQWAAMLAVSVPLAPWASGRHGGAVDEKELAVHERELSLQEMRAMTLSEVRAAWTKAQADWEQLERYRSSMLPRSRQAVASALAGYRTGGTDFLSLLDSERMLQMLEMEEAMLVGNYISDLAAVERVVGIDIEEGN